MTVWVFQGGNGSWFSPSNWLSTSSPPQTGVPGAGDVAEIGSGTADLGVTNDTIAALYLSGGNLAGSSTLTTTGGSQFTGGYVGGSLTLDLEGASLISGFQIGDNANVKNTGTVTDTGNFLIGDGSGVNATFDNASGAVMKLSNPVTISSGASTAQFINSGSLATLSNSETSTFDVNFVNQGTISIASGTDLDLDGANTQLGGTISGAGALIFGGSATLDSGLSLNVASVDMGAGLSISLAGNVTFGGSLNISYPYSPFSPSNAISLDGNTLTLQGSSYFKTLANKSITFGGGGTLITDSATTLDTTGGGTIVLGSGTNWINAGLITCNGTLQIGDSTTSASFTNTSKGTINIDSQYGIASGPASGTITNAGLIEATGGANANISQSVINSGQILAKSGSLTFNGPSVANNGLILASGGNLNLDTFVSNTSTISASTGSSIFLSGGGSLGGQILGNGGAVVMSGTFDVASGTKQSVAFGSGASFAGPGSNQANLSGAGTISTTGTLAITYNGGDSLALGNGVTWQNEGVVNDGGYTYFGFTSGDGVALLNAAGATFNILAAGNVFENANGGGGSIQNAGSFVSSNGGGTSTISTYFVNTGTVAATSGTLELTGGVLGGKVGGGAGNVELEGQYNVSSGQTQSVTFGTGASFAGVGTNEADLSGAGTLSTTGTVAIIYNGGNSLGLGNGVTWQNKGVVNDGGYTYFGFTGGDGVALINAAGATFNILAAGNIFQNRNGGGGSIQNAGSFLTSNGGGTSTISTYFVNTGTVAATSGTLELTGGVLGGKIGGGAGNVVLEGQYNVSNGQAQSVTFASGASFAGVGTNEADLSGAGTLSSTGTVAIIYDGGNSLGLGNGVTWQNKGVVNDGGYTYFGFAGGDGVALINAAGATFNILAGGTVFENRNGGGGNIYNAGLLAKGTGGNTSTISVYVENSGTISASSGLMQLNSGLSNESTGTITATAGAEILIDSGGNFGNAGIVIANGGDVVLSDAVSGTGSVLVESGGTLEIGSNDAQLVVFSGTNDVLRLDDPTQFSGRLGMISVGDTIDLANTTVTAAPTISNGTLTVHTSAGTLTYAITGEITGTSFSVTSDGAGGSDLVLTVPGQVFTLTTGVDSFLGGLGNDIFNAGTGTINAGDSIDGGGGTNTLSLNGSGTFNLSAATALNHIQIVDATDSGQTITLRSGSAFTVQVGTGTVADKIVGANNSDQIHLGTQADKLTLGGPNESVFGGGKNYALSAAGAAVGALIDVADGSNALAVSGGGTLAMNAGDNGISTVTLAAATSAYNFTANAEVGLRIVDQSQTSDIVSAGGIGETLTGGAAGKLSMMGFIGGGTTFLNTSALFNGDTVTNLATSGSVLDISDLSFAHFSGTFSENAAGTAGSLVLSDGTHNTTIDVIGAFAHAGYSGSLSSAGFIVSSDGHSGTAISHS